MDHLQLALADLFRCYDPPVPQHLYAVRFVPVVDDFELQSYNDSKVRVLDPPAASIQRKLPHKLRSSGYCWCDSLTLAANERGRMHRFFVVQIEFKPWNPMDPRNEDLMMPEAPTLNPVFSNEEGRTYFRLNGMTSYLSFSNIQEMIKEKVTMNRTFANLTLSQYDYPDADTAAESYDETDYNEDCYVPSWS